MSFATGDQSDEIVTAAERLDPVVVVFKMHRNLPQVGAGEKETLVAVAR